MHIKAGFQYAQFVSTIKVLRKRLNLSLPKLSELSGVSVTMLHYGETGEKNWSPESCDNINRGMIQAIENEIATNRKKAEDEAKAKAIEAERQKTEDLELAEDLAFMPEISARLTRLANSHSSLTA